MANYKEIKGFHVQSLSSDPVANQAAGGSWASGGSLNTARDYVGGTVTPGSDSALIFGGSSTAVEQYNGSSWTEKTEMNAPAPINYSRYPAGTATAALASGGGSTYSVTVEQWNGSGWTEIADLNEGRGFGSASPIGTVTAALVAGGFEANPGVVVKSNESWNGASWTEVGDLNVARGYNAGLGTSTSALMTNGQAAPPGLTVLNDVESWNGASWTAVSACNSGRVRGVAAGETNSSGLFFGGATGPNTSVAKTEFWDGTSWTEVADLAAGRMRGGGGGTIGIALIAGGDPGPAPTTSATEEWANGPSSFSQLNSGQVYYNSSSTNAFKVTQAKVPTGSWSSGGSLNTARYYLYGFGTQTASIACGGDTGSVSALTELYNGSSWTEVNDLNTARGGGGSAGKSPSTAGLIFGSAGPTPSKGFTESWDGSSWTEVNDLNTAREGIGGFGIQTAAIAAAGYTTTDVNNVESWNGSSWSETTEVNTARRYAGSSGLSTAGMIFGANPATGATEIWNGSAWTEVNDMNTGRGYQPGGCGTTTASLCFGGSATGPGLAVTESWDGTNWTEVSDLATARRSLAGTGTATVALAAGGTPPVTAATEEWTTPAANYTITVG